MNESSTPDEPPAAGGARAGGPTPGVSLRERVAVVWSTGLDLVFPPICSHCHGLIASAESTGGDEGIARCPHVCEGCRRRIVLVQAPHCTTCGHPFFGEVAENLGCAHCETLRPRFGAGRTAALLQGPVRDLVHALKYRKAMHVLRDIVAIVAANPHFRAFMEGARVVPVPLHPRKLRERGFNQAQLIAEIVVRQVPGTALHPVLRRVVDTPTQTRLDRVQRQANLRNAFALAPRPPLEPLARYVLVDDVFTTGSTLNACAAVLRRAGVTRVDVATLGHG